VVSVEMPIEVSEHYLPDGTLSKHVPVEFVICKRREMKNMYNNLAYLKNFVSPI